MPTFDYPVEIVKLAKSFPSLRDAKGLKPWEWSKFDRWLYFQEKSQSELPRELRMQNHAGRFVLEVWLGGSHIPQIGLFVVSQAMWVWDEEHRQAFRAWCAAPWRR